MKKLTTLMVTFVLLAAAPLTFACDYPTSPEIPDGGTAEKEAMIAASKGVKSYQAAMIAYRECLDKEVADAEAEISEDNIEEIAARTNALTKKYNASVDAEELVVARFNESVRAYKAKAD
jgi:hypothetical protein